MTPSPFIKITSDYGWIGRLGWHNTADFVLSPPWSVRVWGMVAWLQGWGPRGGFR